MAKSTIEAGLDAVETLLKQFESGEVPKDIPKRVSKASMLGKLGSAASVLGKAVLAAEVGIEIGSVLGDRLNHLLDKSGASDWLIKKMGLDSKATSLPPRTKAGVKAMARSALNRLARGTEGVEEQVWPEEEAARQDKRYWGASSNQVIDGRRTSRQSHEYYYRRAKGLIAVTLKEWRKPSNVAYRRQIGRIMTLARRARKGAKP